MGYERFGLRTNPFLEEAPDFDQIDRVDVEGKIKKDLQDALDARTPQILVILGEYGMGKTFTLQKMIERIKTGKFFPSHLRNVLAVYFKVAPPKLPTGYTHYVYSSIVEGIG